MDNSLAQTYKVLEEAEVTILECANLILKNLRYFGYINYKVRRKVQLIIFYYNCNNDNTIIIVLSGIDNSHVTSCH